MADSSASSKCCSTLLVGFGHEQQQQPHRAFLPQRPGLISVRFFQRQRRPLQLGVFGDVILQQMGDLFHQAADQLAFIDDGYQIEAALAELGNPAAGAHRQV
jgi:hypothetical protein